ncbi:MAG TPA: ATPase, T2SS/T4P/T4SS family [Methylomirabilota bacterium]|nr:ATPase, T2SS/T4P/T4SS family [Methylomirabilota bacterium]
MHRSASDVAPPAARESGGPAAGTVHTVLLAHSDPEGLRPLTRETPAALLHVGGRPLAELSMESIRAAGVRAAVVAVGPHAEQVEAFLGTGDRWGVALDYVRVRPREVDGVLLARLGAELRRDLMVVRGDVVRSSVVDRFLTAASGRPGTSAWAAIGGVPAGLALVRRADPSWLDLRGGGRYVAWEQAGRRIQFRDATLYRLETVADYHIANVRANALRAAGRAISAPPVETKERPTVALDPSGVGPARNGRLAKYDHLVAQRLVTREQIGEAAAEARRRRVSVDTVLLDHHGVREADLAAALSLYYRCPYVGLEEGSLPDPEILAGLAPARLRTGMWLPLRREGAQVIVAVDDPHDLFKVDTIETMLRPARVTISVAVRERILRALEILTAGGKRRESVFDILGEAAVEALPEDPESPTSEINENDNMVMRLAHHVIIDAHRARASDIHLEPRGTTRETVIRFRVDGTCIDYQRIPPTLRNPLVARLKVMAGLDIAERRKPQDGKMRVRTPKGDEIELRVATVPTVGGNEDIVLRLLGSAQQLYSLETLDLNERNLREIRGIADKPYGLILCVGPTGAGKTTSLHAVLSHLNTSGRKIWTAEDPVEITQDGLRQVQVRPKIGYTFAAALRAMLRADPDVIMVGEMRDPETAALAVEASLTGHLVLSTLHTNSAVETIVRLLDLGINPFNFADALLGVLAQRLVKRLCTDCREPYHPTRRDWNELAHAYGADELEAHGYRYTEEVRLYGAKGCERCTGTGYRERIAIHELLVASDAIKRRMQKHARVGRILARAKREGMTTLVQDGVLKVLAGLTDFRQVRGAAIR